MSLTALAASAVFVVALQGGRPTGTMPAAEPSAAAVPAASPSGGASAPAGAAAVIATLPAQGAVIEPGPLRVAVTFDRPMTPGSYSFVRSDEGAYPDCTGQPQLSADGRTYTVECIARSPGRYVMHFNKPPYLGFSDAATRTPAREARLEFTVTAQSGRQGEAAVAAPRIVRTSPAEGAAIAPGAFTVAITFDRPMAPGSFAFVRSDEGAYPECTGQPQLSADGRTFSLACVASVGARYVMHFNKPPYIGFVDAETRTPAQEARLEFTVREP